MRTNEATVRAVRAARAVRTRRDVVIWLLAATLAACGGTADVQPAVATATAAADAAALATAIASVVSTATRATVTPTSTATATSLPALPPTATPAATMIGAVGSATARSATPPSGTGAATGTRSPSTAITGGTPGGTRSATTMPPAIAAVTGTAQRPASTTNATNATNVMPAPAATVAGGTVSFADPGKRFTFSRPGAWRDAPTVAASRELAVGYISTMPRGSFNVLASSVSASATLEQYTNANIATIKRDVMGYRDGPVGLQAGSLGGTPAQLYDFFATVGGESQLVTQIYCVRNGTLYVLSFITPADATSDEERNGAFYDAAQVIVDTWKFL